MLRKLTRKDVEIILEVEPEETPVRGFYSSTDDPEADRRMEDEIIRRVNNGDYWAWCTVVVKARWGQFTGLAVLGCCSYEDEHDFKVEGGYYLDLVDEALDDLNEKLSATDEALTPLRLGACQHEHGTRGGICEDCGAEV